jgi:hypothetical protein
MLEKGPHGRRIHTVSEYGRAKKNRCNHAEQSGKPTVPEGKKAKE